MPRIKPLTENARYDMAFRKQLIGMMKAEGISYKGLARILGISINTLYKRRDEPETLTLREQRIIKKYLPGIRIE